MILNLTTRTDSLQNVRRRIKLIQDAPPKVLQRVGELEVNDTKNRILSLKVDPDGQSWAPWSMATLRKRGNEGTASLGLLFRNGELYKSIQMRISAKTLTIFSNVGYAKFLQQGTIHMPARRFLGWGNAAINRFKDIWKEETK